MLLYFGMLAYCPYRVVVVVVERCLPAAGWGVTVTMDVSEDVHRI